MIPFLLAGLVIIAMTGIFLFAEEGYKLCSIFGIIPLFCLALYMELCINYCHLYPVDYTVEQTSNKIYILTEYGNFESDKILDFHEWTQNKQGYLIKKI